ncbi:hypothetical protein GGS23DRAFT_547730 [Durotheca rogersii]|uniref:uncharacterized protein n=1 Tax=Durotheca rogersii TaxID=419775 RepID=UPI00221EBA07|nr:uncharacterized protein GGS23DRAFT_547730 [Durotheca rogersii]KAI5867306.1 hypothetical protein GGS23DRAFT_547730 [Durotheca rogersii]
MGPEGHPRAGPHKYLLKEAYMVFQRPLLFPNKGALPPELIIFAIGPINQVIVMVVTELAWLVTALGPVTPAGREAVNQALNVQDEWFARNAPNMPEGREERGVGLFQQVEEPSIHLLTAHWESVDQHGVWLESPENKAVFPTLGAYFELEKTTLFHVDDVQLFDATGAVGNVSLLESPVVSLERLTVAAEGRQAFDDAWREVKGVLEEFAKPNVVKGGWRIEKESPALEEFVVGSGWPSVERHGEFAASPGFPTYASAIEPLIAARDTKHYQRIL